MTLSRRRFMSQAAAITAGFAGLRSFAGLAGPVAATHCDPDAGFGPLIKDPRKLLDLPEGFSYRVFSRTGEKMDDGFYVPGKHDGMAAFAGPDNLTLLVRNHEVTGADFKQGAFGRNNELFHRLADTAPYDPGYGKTPTLGGTTTLVYDTDKQQLVRHYLSLACTERNCAGGPTPWGSWVTCEETVARKSNEREFDHGYNFEVPATADINLADPVPLKAMGRFNHEAIAVDPKSGIVYQTEDRHDGVIYRFIPDTPGQLAKGGKLQFLAIKGKQPADLRNWKQIPKKLQSGGSHDVPFDVTLDSKRHVNVGEQLDVQWMDIGDVEAPLDDLRYRAFKMGAARFARGEGMWYGNDAVYFACTTGGPNAKGQIWRYIPSEHEGSVNESKSPGKLELFIEPNDAEILQHADNLCVGHTGDLVVCEDGGPVNHVLGVTPKGSVYKIARNSLNGSEFAGSCFSPDGSTLFVNIQNPGLTIAITGPWNA
ncbi:MAG: alkaline phosphatase PhoX [Phycisphaeraceae bacterium]